jgi:hypothetical protein
MDESTIGGLLMDLADDRSEEGTTTSSETDAGTVPPVPTEKDPYTMPPALITKEASTTLPAPIGKEASATADKPTNHKGKQTAKHDWPAMSGSDCRSSDDDDTDDEQYISCFQKWLGVDLDCKGRLRDETTMSAHHV